MRNRLLAEITPNDEELRRQRNIIESLATALQERAAAIGENYSFIEPHGSTGEKQTQLRGAADIDLFVALDPQDYSSILQASATDRERILSNRLERLVDEWFRPAVESTEAKSVKKTYSQHPYLSLVMGGLEVDIVACFGLSPRYLMREGPITAVDRTIHHTRYVSNRLDETLRADVRLLKSFTRAGHAYGDKCAVGRMGLTGYCLELMVIWGEGLDGAIKSLQGLTEEPLDPENRSLRELRNRPRFRDDYVFVIDPIDTDRNVASSFSRRSVDWTITRVHDLLETPRDADSQVIFDMFVEKPISATPLPRELQNHYVGFEFESLGSEHYTVIRDKLYSLANKIRDKAARERTGEKRFGECVFELYFEKPRYALGFFVERSSIKGRYRRRGPPTNMKSAAEKFKSEHPEAHEESGYLWITEKRKWTSARQMITHLITKNKIEDLEILEETGDLARKVGNIIQTAVLRVEDMKIEE